MYKDCPNSFHELINFAPAERNYELAEGVCIPRNVVYFNYVDFCSKNSMQPVNAASFGKVYSIVYTSVSIDECYTCLSRRS